MSNYTIPGFWEQQSIIIPLIVLYQNNNFLFKENVKIDSAYGNFYHTIWDGGRAQTLTYRIPYSSYDDILLFQHIYNNILNIPIRFVFTNCLLTEKDCQDPFCNFILKTFSNYPNQITINSSILENYILEKNFNYSLISSITKQLNQEQIYLELEKKQYIKICLPFQYNKDKIFLFNIPQNLKKKCELLINTLCPLNCIFSKKHNEIDSYANLHYTFPSTNYFCAKSNKNILGNAVIKPNELFEYEQNHITNFKLIERMLVDQKVLIPALVTYLIKPQYFEIVSKILFFYMNNWTMIDLKNFSINQFNEINKNLFLI